MSALALGAIAAIPSYFGILLRAKTSLDDSLDVVAAHGLGGTVGALLTGVFAEKASTARSTARCSGILARSSSRARPCSARCSTAARARFVVLKLIGLVMPLRATAAEEAEGLDIIAHGEEAYDAIGGLVAGRRSPRRVRPHPGRSSRRAPTCKTPNRVCWRWRARASPPFSTDRLERQRVPRAQRRQSMFVTYGVRRSALAVVAVVGVMVFTSAPAFAQEARRIRIPAR